MIPIVEKCLNLFLQIKCRCDVELGFIEFVPIYKLEILSFSSDFVFLENLFNFIVSTNPIYALIDPPIISQYFPKIIHQSPTIIVHITAENFEKFIMSLDYYIHGEDKTIYEEDGVLDKILNDMEIF